MNDTSYTFHYGFVIALLYFASSTVNAENSSNENLTNSYYEFAKTTASKVAKYDVIYFLDFYFDRLIEKVLRYHFKKGNLKKKSRTAHISLAVIAERLHESEFYKILTHQQRDKHGLIEMFNNPKWWTEHIYRVSANLKEDASLVIDLFFEVFFRDIFHWLCDSQIVYGKPSIEKLAIESVECLKQEDFYKALQNPNSNNDESGLWKIVNQNEWWLKEGKLIDEKNGTKIWQFI